jgi:beta-1,4-mannosyltransferase
VSGRWRSDEKSKRRDDVTSTTTYATKTSQQARHSVDVLMSPGPNELKDNPVLSLLFSDLASSNIQIKPFSGKASLLRRHDIVHVHWPEWLIRWSGFRKASYDIASLIGALWIARRRGAAVVWTGHNLEPHQLPRPKLWKAFQFLFISQLDLLISFGDGATELLRSRYPALTRKPVVIIPHGHYRTYYDARPTPDAFRHDTGLDERPVLLCFGLIKSYKNVPELIRAWKNLAPPRPQFVVAGRSDEPALEEAIRQEADGYSDIHLMLQFIGDDDVPTLFAASDVLLMPYEARSALNSGVAHLALSLGKPVVMNDTAANKDLEKLFGADWVYLCDATPEDALRAALDAVGSLRIGQPDISVIDYPYLRGRLQQAYLRAVECRRSCKSTIRQGTSGRMRSGK